MGMAEYIEREAAYPLAKKICDAIDSEDFQRLNFGMRILDWIDDIPAADVRPVVKARWNVGAYGWECSNCTIESNNTYPICPYCGAMMEES